MPVYEIEQYELWTSKTRVEADSPTEAIQKLLDGDGDPVDNSSEYIETDDTRGISLEQAEKAGIEFCDNSFDPILPLFIEEWGIPTIRSIEVVE